MTHSGSTSLRLVFVAALTFLAAFAFASPSTTFGGATYLVTKTADTADGTCDADCSLREAVIAANATPGDINLPEGTYIMSIETTLSTTTTP